MQYKENYGAKKKEIEQGHCDPEYKNENQEELDEMPPNSLWRESEDGGFLGRSKGGER